MQSQRVQNSGLYIESIGEGRPVVALHGWGMHSGVYKPVANALKDNYQMHLVDLPGHGLSPGFAGFADINAHAEYIVEQLDSIFKQGIVLMGWSMGGLLAQAIASRYPKYIQKLVLLTATPCFTHRPDWRSGIDSLVLDKFSAELHSDFQKTLGRFLAMQFLGSDDQKENLRHAKQLVFACPAASPRTLEQGLELLQKTDLRNQLDNIQCPVLIINGERDSLVPTTAMSYLTEAIPDARGIICKGAGHAPFLSHTSFFNGHLKRFLDE